MRDERFNGYTNYETWIAAIWMDNKFSDQLHWQKVTMDANNVDEVKEAIDDWLDGIGTHLDGMISDLLNASIEKINSQELAWRLWGENR